MSEKQLEIVKGEIVEAEDKQRYTMSPAARDQRTKIAIAREENRRMMGMINKVAEISRHANINDPETLLDCFHEYLRVAMEEGANIGNMTAYAAMGITHKTADNWLYGRAHKDDQRYRNLIYYVKNICAAYRENLALEGRLNPITTIFWQKNFDGLTNEGIFREEIPDPLGDIKSTQEIIEKYKDMPED